MDYEFQIDEGGIYTVKAFAPEDAASTTSNEVEVNAMTATIKGLGGIGTAVAVSVQISNAIVGTKFRVTLGEDAESGYVDEFTIDDPGTDAHSSGFRLLYVSLGSIRTLSYTSFAPSGVVSKVTNSAKLYQYISGVWSLVSTLSSADDGWVKTQYPTVEFEITPYTNELTIKNIADNVSIGAFGTFKAAFSPEGTVDIDVSAIPTPDNYTDSEFGLKIPKNAVSVTFSPDPESIVQYFSDYYDTTMSFVDNTIQVMRLEAPTLTYSASEGKLKWDEVEGADRYEVWKDGVKIADIPKRTE